MRIIFTVFAIAAVVMIGLTLRATNSNRDLIRFTGRWAGGFNVESIESGPNSETDRKRSRLEGYVQIYLTGRTFKLHLEGEQETIDVDGTWTAKGNRLTLNGKEVKIDDQGGADKRDPNKKYIANEDVLATFNRPIVLVQSANKQRYEGLPMTFGPLVGRHAFDRDGP